MTGNGVVLEGEEGCTRIPLKNCSSYTCYPGVQCHFDHERGAHCGSCPEDMIGDGSYSGCRRMRLESLVKNDTK